MPGAFLYQNVVPAGAAASGFTQVATMPPANLANPQPRVRMRASSPGGSCGIVLDMLAARTLDCVALISTTLDPAIYAALTLRLRLSTADATGAAGDAWDTGTAPADTSAATNGNVVFLRTAGAVSARYLRLDVTSGPNAVGPADVVDIGLIIAGSTWRLARGHAYGIEEGRLILDRRDRNDYTAAEFAVPALGNPRTARFTLPVLSTAEVRGQHRALLRSIGGAGDALWIPDTGLSRAELNARCLWGAINLPGQPAVTVQRAINLHQRAFALTERL
jgi:hypothetical protein